ncbi:MAG TPA: SHD1 domain-containing protein [Lacipirellulaceae bacterium]|nr:SHD1 domain-containing protein [Lacipirellulaceae bacterium]
MSKLLLVIAVVVALPNLASARIWTDSTGRYTIDADLIAFNGQMVVLKRADHQLGEVPIDKLSKADRKYLVSKEANDAMAQVASAKQTWTMRSGLKVVGRVVGYARKELILQRRGGQIYVNDRLFDGLPRIYQIMIPKIVAHSAHLARDDKQGLDDWLVGQQGQPRSFTVDGALLQFEDGNEYVVPFFFFSEGDLALLKPGWDQWVAAKTKQQQDQQQQQSFLLQSLMAARQRDQQIRSQIAEMQLNQQILMGNTSLWEVTLYPGRGTGGRPQWVVMPGINSGVATRNALARYPGYIPGPVRKVAGYRY